MRRRPQIAANGPSRFQCGSWGALAQPRYLTVTGPFMPSASWPATEQYIS